MSAPAAPLRALQATDRIERIDLEFARLMERLGQGVTPEISAVIALASAASRRGELCVDLSGETDRHLPRELGGALPKGDLLRNCLLDTGVVTAPGGFAPLVVDERHRLYLYRYWLYESSLAAGLKARAAAEMKVDEVRLAEGLSRHFGDHGGDEPDWQKVAATVAVLKRFCVIAGGPGTGKTTTVVKILALLQAQAEQRPLEIALAAPTGKAAGRLQHSIIHSIDRLAVSAGIRDTLPREALTLHRLLGVTDDPGRFRHDRHHPLPYDVVVVDEASMIDVALMAKLLDALPAGTRLLLLGDKDQLASVEAGAVLADICANGAGFSPAFRDKLRTLTGEPLPDVPSQAGTLGDAVVTLRRSYRFPEESGIGAFANAVNLGDAVQAAALLSSPRHPDLSALSGRREAVTRILEGYAPYLDVVRSGADPAEVFAAFERFRVLCALRSGPFGVEEVNRLVEGALEAEGLVRPNPQGYPGMPVMITRNDYGLRLFNGDIGILLPDGSGALSVCFIVDPSGEPRRLALARLEAWEPVFAMTVHKSQGSEFDNALLILPERDAPILTRELLYTAVTRARRSFELLAAPDILQLTVERRLNRVTGLGDALRE